MQQDRQQQPQAYQDQGMPKPQPKPLQLVTPQQELQATRESYRRLLGYTPEAWQDVMNLPAEQGAELIGRQFNALKAPGLKGKTSEIGRDPDVDKYLFNVEGIDPRMATLEDRKRAYNLVNQKKDTRAKLSGTHIGSIGGNSPIPLEKAGLNKVDEALLDQGARRLRLNSIQRSFDPKFLTIPYQFDQATQGWKERLGGTLTPEQREAKTQFTDFKIGVVQNLNSYIKEITGAALSEKEAERIIASMPNMDTGPTDFKSALNKITSDLSMAEARLQHIKTNGLRVTNVDSISLASMPLIMKSRAATVEKQLRASGIKDEAVIKSKIRNQLASEFGLLGE